jgi:translation initiation factor 1
MNKEKSRLVYSTDKTVPEKDNPAEQKFSTLALHAQQQVYIRLERKGRGGKSVSIISGLQQSQQDNEVLLKHLKTKLGTGGTIKNNTLEIQGDHRDNIFSLLQKMGYRPKLSGG